MAFKEGEKVFLEVVDLFDKSTKQGTVTKVNTKSIYVDLGNTSIRFNKSSMPIASDWVFGTARLFHSEYEYLEWKLKRMNEELERATYLIKRVYEFKDEFDVDEIDSGIEILNNFNNDCYYLVED